jgi:toxin ParE1/3/4
MAGYKLSKRAAADYDDIFVYGVQTFGLQQAETYLDGMDVHFDDIATWPRLHQALDHIRTGYRRSVYRSHTIYYPIDGSSVVIVRILGRQNLATALYEPPKTSITQASVASLEFGKERVLPLSRRPAESAGRYDPAAESL